MRSARRHENGPKRVNAAVGAYPIEHDLVSLAAEYVHRQTGFLNYLEIGVSVLKNVDTQVHFHHATVTAFDIEDPNWTRAKHWGKPRVVSQARTPGANAARSKKRAFDHLYEWRDVAHGNVVR